jgi:hypothetical protein
MMSNALIYLELARQLNREQLDETLGRRRSLPEPRERRHWLPKLPPVPLRWRPARVVTASPVGCTA